MPLARRVLVLALVQSSRANLIFISLVGLYQGAELSKLCLVTSSITNNLTEVNMKIKIKQVNVPKRKWAIVIA